MLPWSFLGRGRKQALYPCFCSPRHQVHIKVLTINFGLWHTANTGYAPFSLIINIMMHYEPNLRVSPITYISQCATSFIPSSCFTFKVPLIRTFSISSLKKKKKVILVLLEFQFSKRYHAGCSLLGFAFSI